MFDQSHFVSLEDYLIGSGGEGVGGGDVESLHKALEAGYLMGIGGERTGGSALRVESLQDTLVEVSWANQNILKLWTEIGKHAAYSTVEEYTRRNAYGQSNAVSGFFLEGGLPDAQNQSLERRATLIRFMGTTRSVTHPATLVRMMPGVDARTIEKQAGTRWLLEQLERALFFANSSVIATQFDGYFAQLEAAIDYPTGIAQGKIIDKRGIKLTEEDLEDAARVVHENFGNATRIFCHTSTLADFSKLSLERQRYIRLQNAAPAPTGFVGAPLKGVSTNYGDVEFRPDIFFVEPSAGPTTAQGVATLVLPVKADDFGVTAVAGADALSLFGASDDGDYMYAVSSVNMNGESACERLSNGTDTYEVVAVATGDKVTLTIVAAKGKWDASTLPDGIDGFRIYRSAVGALGTTTAASCGLIASIPRAAGTGDTTFVDYNRYLPFTKKALVLDMDPMQVSVWRQLLPLMSLDLAVVSASFRFMVLLYGALQVTNVNKMVRVINIGVNNPPE